MLTFFGGQVHFVTEEQHLAREKLMASQGEQVRSRGWLISVPVTGEIGAILGEISPDTRLVNLTRPMHRCRARREQLERVSRSLSGKWLKSRPESGLGCLICAEFAVLAIGVTGPVEIARMPGEQVPAWQCGTHKTVTARFRPWRSGKRLLAF